LEVGGGAPFHFGGRDVTPPADSDPNQIFPSLGSVVREDEPMSRHTTLAVGGPADHYVEVGSRDQLRRLNAFCRERGLPLFPVGQGSNLLVEDGGIRGVVVRLRGDFETFAFNGDEAAAGAGALMPALANACAEKGLAGAEFMAGIPGTLGGGLLTNAGTPEGDLGSIVQSVEVFDGEFSSRPRERLEFSYRHANLGGNIVTAVVLKFRRGDPGEIRALMQRQLDRRAERQPLGTFNCGSVFKNPPGDHAGRLIEAAGLKGLRIGGARISPKHANFIENTEKAGAADVKALIDLARARVKERFGVELELEVWRAGVPR